jgi:hypothetical protein
METHSDRLEAYATTSRRATSNHETRRFPEFFPKYFKTDQNSRVSFKDPKDGKMCSFKFPTFESYWTYVNKRQKIDRTCETSEGRNFKCQRKSEIRNSNGPSFVRLCLFAPLRRKQRSAAQHRTMKQATNPDFFQKDSRPTRCCGSRILKPQDVPT